MDYDWREVPGWFTEGEAAWLSEAARKVSPGQCIVEVGSYCGRSAVVLGLSAPDKVPVYCIDRWEGIPEDSFEVGVATRNGWPAQEPMRTGHHGGMSAAEFEANLRGFGLLHTKVFPIVGDFGKVAERITFPPIGLLFLDADHSEEETVRAFKCYQPKLAPGATVFFHDVQAYPAVALAIRQLALTVEPRRNLALWQAP